MSDDALASMAPPESPYVNQTVKSVRLEAYFRGQFDVLSRCGIVQSRLREQFPDLLVPNVTAIGEALALRPFQLRNVKSNTEALGLAIHQVSYVSYRYPGFEKFCARAVELLTDALRDLQIDELERVSFQYDNELGIPRLPDGSIPLDQLLLVDVKVGEDLGRFIDIDMKWSRQAPGGRLHHAVQVERGEVGDKLKFTIAAEVTPAGPASRLDELARQAHAQARRYFDGLITPAFHDFLQGKMKGGAS